MPNPPVLDGEQRRDVPGREGEYLVSSLGRVWSHYRGGRLLHTWLNGEAKKNADYYRVGLGRGEQRYVHHLVAEAFHGERPEDHPTEGPYYACHANGDRHRNHAANLYWGTAAENVADAQRHGTYRPPVRWRDRRTGDLFAGSGGEVACA